MVVQPFSLRWSWRRSWARISGWGRSVLRPYAEIRRQVLGQGEAAEEQGGVGSIARERVPEEGHAGDIARRQTRAGGWVAVQKSPHTAVGDHETLQSAEGWSSATCA